MEETGPDFQPRKSERLVIELDGDNRPDDARVPLSVTTFRLRRSPSFGASTGEGGSFGSPTLVRPVIVKASGPTE